MTRPLPRPPAGLLDQLTPMHWAIGGVVAGLVLARFGGPLLRRFWFRTWWLNPDSEEYQRQTHWDRHGSLTDSRSHIQRRGETAVERRARLLRLLGYGILAAPGAAMLWEAWFHAARPFGYDFNLRTTELGFILVMLLGVFVAPITLCAVANAAWNLLWELAYLTGLQGWRYARVLDPPAAQPDNQPWNTEEPPFSTGGPANPQNFGALFGDNTPTMPNPKFKD